MKPNILVGGQAVIEGVMMRVPGAYCEHVLAGTNKPKGLDCEPYRTTLFHNKEGCSL